VPPTDAQALALLAWVPAAYFTARGALLVDFRPMARFALVAGALSLPLAWGAFSDAAALAGPAVRRAALALGAASLVAWPLWLALSSYGQNGALAEWSRPMSPVSSAPPGIAEAARWLRRNVQPSDTVLLDGAWHFLDIVLAFDAHLPEQQLTRRAWPDFDAKFTRAPPTLAVLIDGGSLVHEGAKAGADAFSYRGLRFCAEAHFVYASVYRRCGAAPRSAEGQALRPAPR
jgi:hypothetical protein